ncbi:hypothetical protein TrCOL_g2807 [Triparma columacea]|uniref:Transmembrane protein 230 n=1 Tax=Triparma columacea TaxID=722753 RepID=A0A9W7G960_9STRA|nr:hypothetical protein TrCOL_g2807 [Triparma columacea]
MPRYDASSSSSDQLRAPQSSFSTARQKIPIRRRLPPPMTTLAAILLLSGGVVCTCFGLSEWMNREEATYRDRGKTMTLLGSIMLLPGSYASFMLFASFREWPGYDYSQIPSYDDNMF